MDWSFHSRQSCFWLKECYHFNIHSTSGFRAKRHTPTCTRTHTHTHTHTHTQTHTHTHTRARKHTHRFTHPDMRADVLSNLSLNNCSKFAQISAPLGSTLPCLCSGGVRPVRFNCWQRRDFLSNRKYRYRPQSQADVGIAGHVSQSAHSLILALGAPGVRSPVLATRLGPAHVRGQIHVITSDHCWSDLITGRTCWTA